MRVSTGTEDEGSQLGTLLFLSINVGEERNTVMPMFLLSGRLEPLLPSPEIQLKTALVRRSCVGSGNQSSISSVSPHFLIGSAHPLSSQDAALMSG